jgi:hypothetical protein
LLDGLAVEVALVAFVAVAGLRDEVMPRERLLACANGALAGHGRRILARFREGNFAAVWLIQSLRVSLWAGPPKVASSKDHELAPL